MTTAKEMNEMDLVNWIQVSLVGKAICRMTVKFPMTDAVFLFDQGFIRSIQFGKLDGLSALYYALAVDWYCPKVVQTENLTEIGDTSKYVYTLDDVKFIFERVKADQLDKADED